ncbi:MAG: hypothetical protein EOM12_17835 [Verrucomicrobiae bacterium]|nr:hypothetical protein [Verrucomicrobiae bacterium]
MNAGHGLFLWEAYRKTPEGLVIGQVRTNDQLAHIQHYANSLTMLDRPQVYLKEATALLAGFEQGLEFEHIFARNILSRAKNEQVLIRMLSHKLSNNGALHLCESVPQKGSRLSDFVNPEEKILLKKAEEILFGDPENPLTNWDEADLTSLLSAQDLLVEISSIDLVEKRSITEADINRYLTTSYIPALAALHIEIDAKTVQKRLTDQISNTSLNWKHHLAFVHARGRE